MLVFSGLTLQPVQLIIQRLHLGSEIGLAIGIRQVKREDNDPQDEND